MSFFIALILVLIAIMWIWPNTIDALLDFLSDILIVLFIFGDDN